MVSVLNVPTNQVTNTEIITSIVVPIAEKVQLILTDDTEYP